MDAIDEIFHNYNKNYLKVVEPSVLVNKLRKSTDNIIKLLDIYEYNFNFRLPSKQEIVELRNYIIKRNI